MWHSRACAKLRRIQSSSLKSASLGTAPQSLDLHWLMPIDARQRRSHVLKTSARLMRRLRREGEKADDWDGPLVRLVSIRVTCTIDLSSCGSDVNVVNLPVHIS